ncbi:MAG: hypothetical protein CVV21_05550 [Candidatus Goldiibacteriota bacterium HGW-Goldbacteria-1]|jgi:tetratricopeptide (TPR) repeat protein|nr:MAG: hypothetical protein CVV21_05550 [Candidatus Goldiibacteriota bacterium HGW-Goldbacteria-1]
MKKTYFLISAALVCLFFTGALYAKPLPEFNPGDCGGWNIKYKTAPASMPWSSADRIAGARDFLIQGDIINSINYYKALKDSGEWSKIRPEYAMALGAGGMYEPAVNFLDTDRQEEPYGAAAYYYAGWVYHLAGYRDMGRDMWKAAQNGGGYHAYFAKDALNTTNPEKLYCAGKLGADKPLPRYVKSAEPDTAEARESLKTALMYYSEEKYFSAAYAFRKMAEKYPGWVIAYMGCSLALEGAGAFDSARAAAEAAQTITGLGKADGDKVSQRVKELGQIKQSDKEAWMRNKNPELETPGVKDTYVISFGGANMGFGGGGDFSLALSGRLGIMVLKEMEVSLGAGFDTLSGLNLSVGATYRYFIDENYSLNPGTAVIFGVSGDGLSISIALNGGFSWYLDKKSSSADIILSLNKTLVSDDPSVSVYVGTTRYF